MARKNKIADLFSGGDPSNVDTLGRQLAYALAEEPNIAVVALVERFKVSRQAIDSRLKSKDFKAFQIKLESNIYEKIGHLRAMAARNTENYLKKPDSQAALEMTKILMKAPAEHPSTLPPADVAEPEFYDPGDGDKR